MTETTRRKPGPAGVNWLAARTMFLEGCNISQVARRLGVRRENVSRRAKRENWRAQLRGVCTESARQIVAEAVRSNADVLRAHDAAAEVLFEVTLKRLGEIKAGTVPFDADEVQQLARTLSSTAAVQRTARGLTPTYGLSHSDDRRFVVEVCRMPPTRAEYELSRDDDVA